MMGTKKYTFCQINSEKPHIFNFGLLSLIPAPVFFRNREEMAIERNNLELLKGETIRSSTENLEATFPFSLKSVKFLTLFISAKRGKSEEENACALLV